MDGVRVEVSGRNKFINLRDGDGTTHGHHGIEIPGSHSVDEVPGFIALRGLDQGQVRLDAAFEDVHVPVELPGLLSICNDRAYAGAGIEAGNAGSAGAESFGKCSLWCELKFEFISHELALELCILAHVGTDHLPDLSSLQKKAKPPIINTCVVRDDREVTYPCIPERYDQLLRDAAEPEATYRDGHAVLDNTFKRICRVSLDFGCHMRDDDQSYACLQACKTLQKQAKDVPRMKPPMTIEDMTLMDRLKSETSKAHADTEAIPFNACIMSGSMPQARYAGQLSCWHRLHVALEDALAASTNDRVQAVWQDTTPRVPLLALDLQWHPDADVPDEAQQATAAMISWIESFASSDPIRLLGVLYVLEGSTLGGMILRKSIAGMYGIEEDEGLAYYSAHGKEVMPNWMLFKARMNSSIACSEEQDRIVDTACGTFEHVGHVLRGLSEGLPSQGD
jgi:heme oxygenase